jgi:thioredoxin-related protein
MKKILLLSFMFIILLSGLSAVDVTWLTDFEQAKVQAEKQNKYILIDFSGSDWCRWCVKLDQEVFSKPAFKSFAEKNLVLFMADFPRKIQLSDE